MSDDKPDIIVFPPLATLIALFVAIALGWLIPLSIFAPFATLWSVVLGICIILASFAVAASGIREFKAAGTNVDPRHKTKTIVDTGIYRVTRNPMYLGMVVLQLGLGFCFSLDWTVITAPILFVVLHFGVVLREEEYLTKKFGDEYTEFLTRSRRSL